MSSNKEETDLNHILEQKNKELADKNRALELEASLNVVRSSALSMITSNDLSTTIAILFQELEKLGLKTIRCGIGIFNDDSNKVNVWTASEDQSEKVVNLSGDEYLEGHPLLNGIYSHWKKQQNFAYTLKGQDLIEYYSYTSKTNLPVSPPTNMDGEIVQYYYCVMFPAGGLFAFKDREFDQNSKLLMARFAEVFHFAFIRHQDLIKAEAQVYEAKIEASLEKVRSRSMAMQDSTELLDVIGVMAEQISELNIPFHTISFGTIDQQNVFKFWMSSPGQKTPFLVSAPNIDNPAPNRVFEAQNKGLKFFADTLTQKENKEWVNHLIEHSNVKNYPKKILEYVLESPGFARSTFLLNGIILYVGNYYAKPFSDTVNSILQRFANVFEQSYTRFLDLQKAEANAIQAEKDLVKIKAARKKAEDALKELKLTQKQLIQSEKMASLGELTAGIAHEIQNPLNFVNNFSEVSSELLDEILEEIDSGDLEEVKAIIHDIKENLNKINHHGSRADSIVKGMLQHSRESSGEKEEVNINQLVDEYLRLAYHGFRAKDKSFNSELETDYCDSLKTIKVVPQDIGRVFLNIITNAFQAVTEKKHKSEKKPTGAYQPSVSVKTSEQNNKIVVEIKDNGLGMSEDVKNKIFQPFFTTKPTGQGTGLGMSLSYDIIQAHNGTIEIDSTEGEGTQFCVILPLSH